MKQTKSKIVDNNKCVTLSSDIPDIPVLIRATQTSLQNFMFLCERAGLYEAQLARIALILNFLLALSTFRRDGASIAAVQLCTTEHIQYQQAALSYSDFGCHFVLISTL